MSDITTDMHKFTEEHPGDPNKRHYPEDDERSPLVTFLLQSFRGASLGISQNAIFKGDTPFAEKILSEIDFTVEGRKHIIVPDYGQIQGRGTLTQESQAKLESSIPSKAIQKIIAEVLIKSRNPIDNGLLKFLTIYKSTSPLQDGEHGYAVRNENKMKRGCQYIDREHTLFYTNKGKLINWEKFCDEQKPAQPSTPKTQQYKGPK